MLRDLVRGCFAGHFSGDALGAPHEFYKWNRNTVYTGKLEIQPYRQRDARFSSPDNRVLTLPIGSVTDDTQMTITLIKTLINNDGVYIKDDTILAYSKWTHSGPQDIGTNTRYLFTNKTVKGYHSRVAKQQQEIASGKLKISLSNGALMRCAPLALIKNYAAAVDTDVNLTNPYDETVQVNRVYIEILRILLLDEEEPLEAVRGYLCDVLESHELVDTVEDAILDAMQLALTNKQVRDVDGRDKGRAVHALYCAVGALLLNVGYTEAIKWVITQGSANSTGRGDSDTNAAIAGALIGAHYGFDALMKEENFAANWQVLLSTAGNVVEPLKSYVPHDFDDMIDNYLAVTEIG